MKESYDNTGLIRPIRITIPLKFVREALLFIQGHANTGKPLMYKIDEEMYRISSVDSLFARGPVIKFSETDMSVQDETEFNLPECASWDLIAQLIYDWANFWMLNRSSKLNIPKDCLIGVTVSYDTNNDDDYQWVCRLTEMACDSEEHDRWTRFVAGVEDPDNKEE